MLNDIIELIKRKEYDAADKALQDYIDCDNAKTQATAYFLIGYINSCLENKYKDVRKARMYLLKNINSEYPYIDAYTLYAKLEEDKNIIEKYLNRGLLKFPNNPEILYALLINSQDKKNIIKKIRECGSTDFVLLSKVIEILIEENQWEKINRYISRIQSNNTLDDYETLYLDLLNGFSAIFGERTDYSKAIELLENVEKRDFDNNFGYAHYLGLIYAYLKNNSRDKAIVYFDKLPINNSIFDFIEGPWHFIFVIFHDVYKKIFDLLENEFKNDQNRRKKSRCLFALYLYNPSVIYDLYRYDENDINYLKDYYDENYNKHIALALIDMYCHFQKNVEANSIFLSIIKNGDIIDGLDCIYPKVVDTYNKQVLKIIANNTIDFIENNSYFDVICNNNIIDILVEKLKENKLYTEITKIGEYFTIEDLCSFDSAFYFAYSYNEIKSIKGFEIYKSILEKDPDNPNVMNNIGVILEEKGDYEESLFYFEKAKKLSKTELHINNACRVKEKIKMMNEEIRTKKKKELREIAKNLKLEYLEEIGYNEKLISKFSIIQDDELRKILLRDLKECVIAIVTGQTKNATIMAGSIIEALLYLKLDEKGINIYNFDNSSKKTLNDMTLSNLLDVAKKEQIITSNNIYLSHYVRNYRNFIHPAKEIRSIDKLSQENVMVIWSILKRLIDELL